uniref:SFRICE_034152 n=1 Tax=Spodoptera frugiperda TaxID=7108 RepID=A0A2H1V081_SPOFR
MDEKKENNHIIVNAKRRAGGPSLPYSVWGGAFLVVFKPTWSLTLSLELETESDQFIRDHGACDSAEISETHR